MQAAGNLARTESRVAQRDRVMLSANIAFSNGAFSTSCVVSQLSATGARISLAADAPIAERFRIRIAQRGMETEARLVWRRASYAGIAFVDDGPQPTAGRGDGLEEENRRLKMLVAQLELRVKELSGAM